MRILFIAIILACILFAGAVFIVSKTQTAKSIDESVCDEIYNINLENICHLLISGDINSCNDVGGYDTFCFDSVLEVSDISEGFCNIINNSYGKLKCYNNLAIKTENPDFCMDNEDCYIMLASVSSNEKICDFFTDGVVERNMCMAGANGNEEYCQNIENDFQRRLCLMKFSQE